MKSEYRVNLENMVKYVKLMPHEQFAIEAALEELDQLQDAVHELEETVNWLESENKSLKVQIKDAGGFWKRD